MARLRGKVGGPTASIARIGRTTTRNEDYQVSVVRSLVPGPVVNLQCELEVLGADDIQTIEVGDAASDDVGLRFG